MRALIIILAFITVFACGMIVGDELTPDRVFGFEGWEIDYLIENCKVAQASHQFYI